MPRRNDGGSPQRGLQIHRVFESAFQLFSLIEPHFTIMTLIIGNLTVELNWVFTQVPSDFGSGLLCRMLGWKKICVRVWIMDKLSAAMMFNDFFWFFSCRIHLIPDYS